VTTRKLLTALVYDPPRLLVHAVRNPQLRVRASIQPGVISYSLDFWQVLFLGKLAFSWSVLGAILAAELVGEWKDLPSDY
jgi:hypothetical protein